MTPPTDLRRIALVAAQTGISRRHVPMGGSRDGAAGGRGGVEAGVM